MTQRLHAVIAFSQDYAETHSLRYITPEILMLGILEQENDLAVTALKALNVPVDEIKGKIIDSLPPCAESRTVNVVLTPRSQQVIDLAYNEAKMMRQSFIGTEHILLGLIAEKGGMPARLLKAEGITIENARQAVANLYPVGSTMQQEEQKTPTFEQMEEEWRKIIWAQLNNSVHLPTGILLFLRAMSGGVFLLFCFVFLFELYDDFLGWGGLFVIGFLTLLIWRMGVSPVERNAATQLRQWNNLNTIGTLCDMTAWADRTIRQEAFVGLVNLLPKITPRHTLFLEDSHRRKLCKLLTPVMAEQETDLIRAILRAFEQVGTSKEKPAVARLAEIQGDTPPISHVREAAQSCLRYLELMEEGQSQQQTLLRAATFAPTENLLRPSTPQAETQSEELLRPIEANDNPTISNENEAAL